MTVTAGPAESAIRSLTSGRRPEAQGGLIEYVEACPRSKMADVRIGVASPDGQHDGSAEGLARELSAWAEVEQAKAVPPRVYVRLDLGFLREAVTDRVVADGLSYGHDTEGQGRTALVSFSSPNANKPLHLGHLRNNVIGMALASMLEARGWKVLRGEVVSDWGVHICQALLAHQLWGDGETPEQAGEKPDHFVGSHYVLFHQRADESLEQRAARMLARMERGDEELQRLNFRLTGWAEEGIRQTYRRIGTRFDVVYRESESRRLGREVVEAAAKAGRAMVRQDGSVYVDLGGQLGEITLLRSDGTPVVYTQLIGFHVDRFRRTPYHLCPTLLGREWEAGAVVVDEILRRWGSDFVDRIERVHYGLVRLEDGRMRSRDGTTVSADELLDQACGRLEKIWAQSGTTDEEACSTLATGVVKHLFLEVRRTKDVVYDPDVLWERALGKLAAAVRTLIWSDWEEDSLESPDPQSSRRLLNHLNFFPTALSDACHQREPAILTRYLEELVLLTRPCRRHLDARSRLATRIVICQCLRMLNIELPKDLDALPPPFAPPTQSSKTTQSVGAAPIRS